MATNKRKEAAALFELIDKSTLKVPKNAGALKIPSWWSSKTNPSPAPTAPVAPPRPTPSPLARTSGQPAVPQVQGETLLPTNGNGANGNGANGHGNGSNGYGANGHGVGGQTNGNAHAYPVSATAGSAEAPAKLETQARLFQPPPANAPPASTPSIRPPARVPMTPTVSAPAAAPVPVEVAEAAPVKDTLPAEEEEGAAVAAAEEVRPVAGTSKGTARGTSGGGLGSGGALGSGRQWPPADRNFFANVPPWALPVAAGTLVVLIVAVLFVALRHHGGAPAGTSTGGTGITGVGTGQGGSVETSITGPGGGAAGGSTAVGPSGGGGGLLPQPQDVSQGGAPAPAPAPGNGSVVGGSRVYEPGQYRFNPESLYVFIATSSSESVTRRNAKFIAEHGVDVAIEKSKDSFYLIAAQPFPSNVAAESMVKKIREIGKLHPDYKTTRKVFADAVTRHVAIGK